MAYRYLLQNMDWLEEELGGYEDDYLIFDCPGMLHLHYPKLIAVVPGTLDTDTFTQVRSNSIHIIHSFPYWPVNSHGSDCAPAPPT